MEEIILNNLELFQYLSICIVGLNIVKWLHVLFIIFLEREKVEQVLKNKVDNGSLYDSYWTLISLYILIKY